MAGEAEKILIIVYYWPPSGGSGVQRWVKLSKYLAELGVQVHVLTVDEKYASYMQIDSSLADEVHPGVRVVKTRSVEIINLFAKLFGKKKVPTAGFYNLDRKSFVHNLGLLIRSSFFIPDPRRGWNHFAYKKACDIIRKEGITKVITSSPPHSSQLIGLKLKKKLGVEWTADLRDPWTDIFYYNLLRHTFLSRRIDSNYELSVLKHADHVFTVSGKLKEIFISKDKLIDPGKFFIIPNGFDPADFQPTNTYYPGKDFVIGYTGTITDQYNPEGFLRAFRNMVNQSQGTTRLEITGTVSPKIISFIDELGISDHVVINTPIPHKEIPALLVRKDALLLVIPRVEHSELILTGKLFEYLASGRPIILVGPKNGDAESIMKECGAGESFEWDSEIEMTDHLLWLKNQHDKKMLTVPENGNLATYSRLAQALQIRKILFPRSTDNLK
jgi:glycosyltransferase involved in cell wall biosynthesis